MCCGYHQQEVNTCGCHGVRHYLTNEEKAERLEEYKKGLEKELEGVKQRISELR